MNPDMGNMPSHYPQRGDQVEAWLKDRRDHYSEGGVLPSDVIYQVLEELVDEYRLAADTGRDLDEIVNGDHEAPKTARKKKTPKEDRNG